jgi:transcription termination factor Rho
MNSEQGSHEGVEPNHFQQRRWRPRRRRRRGGGGGGGGGMGMGGMSSGGGFGGSLNQGGPTAPGGIGPELPAFDNALEPVSGVLEVQKDGAGWLRQARNSYLPAEGHDTPDCFVPSGIVRQYRMLEGSGVEGQGGVPIRGARRLTLSTVTTIDGLPADEAMKRKTFKDLTVIDPQPMFVLEPGDGDVSLRIIDLLCPLGKGQRGLIVAPPRSGKTVLLQKICHAVSERYPEIFMIVLLIDERPEEATSWRRSVMVGANREVIVSTLDEGAKHHVRVSEMALKRAQRLVERGVDVVILLDSITRLTRAYNAELGSRGGGTMSGGLSAKVFEMPKKFFGSARNCEEGGSLTILGTTLVDTGSRADQVIFEEFKGTGNMELVLNRQLAERRIFPAIDIELSGTRKEELLLGPSVTQRLYTLRRVLARMNALDAMPLLIDKLMKTKSNAQFLDSFRIEE